MMVGWATAAWTSTISVMRRAISACSDWSSARAASRSASLWVESSCTRRSPALTIEPFDTAMAWTRPTSSGWITLERPLGWMRPCASA